MRIAAEQITASPISPHKQNIVLTVVGPETARSPSASPTRLATHGLAVFGPSRLAAELEDKVFAKLFIWHATAFRPPALAHFPDEARAAEATFGFPVVVKADNSAPGQGGVPSLRRWN